ncbi:hypothetical protein IFR05_008203 [Cadophora sp. M221]|nr:hypothetical protein IFR05_008203 [Cadophora sp. M221]
MDGREGCLVDTPGFDDTTLTETEVLTQISTWLAETLYAGHRVTGIIYLLNIMGNRMTGSAIKNHVVFEKLCGTDSLKNLLIVTTHWDKMDFQDGSERESEIFEHFFQHMIDGGARTARHDNTPQSASNCLRKLLGNPPIIMSIQRELLHQKLPLGETAAGLAVNEEMSAVKKKLEEQYKENLANIQAAQNKRMEKLFKEQNERYGKKLEAIELAKHELENGNQHFTNKLADLQKQMDEQSKAASQPTRDYMLDVIERVGKVLAPIATAAISNRLNGNTSASSPKETHGDIPFLVPILVSDSESRYE